MIMEDDKTIYAYFGHHKCATKTMLGIIRDTCAYLGLKHAQFHAPKEWGYGVSNRNTLDEVVCDYRLDFVSYTNTDMKYLGKKEKMRGVHLVRDPRDIAVSGYFSHYYSHSTQGWPELVEFRERLKTLSKDDGMLENIKFTAQLPVDGVNLNLFDALMKWDYSLPNILELKFENFISNPYQSILNAFGFLGLVEDTRRNELDPRSMVKHQLARVLSRSGMKIRRLIPVSVLLYFTYKHDFFQLSSKRNRGDEDVSAHYRKGIAGDWKNHFNDEHKRYFKENFNDLLVKMGYEKDLDW